jgi:hypothetical protein
MTVRSGTQRARACFVERDPTSATELSPKLSSAADTLPPMNIDIWLPPVLAAIIGALLSQASGKGSSPWLECERAGSSMFPSAANYTLVASRWTKRSFGPPLPPIKLS